MLRLTVILLVIAIALLRGGSLHNVTQLPLRWNVLVLSSLALQLLIFTPFRSQPLVAIATPWIYVFSMLLLTLWVALNRHIPGMLLMAVGLLMNLAAITANNGHMPVSLDGARFAGTIVYYPTSGTAIVNNSLASNGPVQLWLLTDIIAVPRTVPFANVFSIGDIVLTAGAALLCYRTIARPRTGAPALAETTTSAHPID